MSIETYNQIKTYIDANIDTNGVGSITGSIHNATLVSYILKNINSLNYDTTRPYHEDQLCFRISSNVYGLFRANTDMSAGAWNASNWDYLIGVETVTDDIDGTGSQSISHNLGIAPKFIQVESSTGENVAINVTARSTTTITINSLVAYSSAQIHLISWGS